MKEYPQENLSKETKIVHSKLMKNKTTRKVAFPGRQLSNKISKIQNCICNLTLSYVNKKGQNLSPIKFKSMEIGQERNIPKY